jgi:hypothetical protein
VLCWHDPSRLPAHKRIAMVQSAEDKTRACRTFQISETCYRYSPILSDENEEIADWLERWNSIKMGDYRSNGPLHLLIPLVAASSNCQAVDSTGIKVEGEGEWNARKHEGPSGGSGARYILGSMSKHWRFGPSIAWQAICMANLPRGEITASHIGAAHPDASV